MGSNDSEQVKSRNKTFKIGTRDSVLAMTQTNWVKAKLKEKNPGLQVEVISMKTKGDKILDKALSKTGDKNLFTKELEDALLDGRVDMVVNSLKDMPSTLPDGLTISAVSERENPYDCVVMRKDNVGKKLCDLKPGSVVGTSSLRRVAQLTRAYPTLKFRSIRGNLQTRFRKLDEATDFDCMVLAVAGLTRLGMQDRISQVLDQDTCLYAIGQGALAVETRASDDVTIRLVSSLHCKKTVLRTVAERAFLKTLGGGCSVPQGVHSWISEDGNQLGLTGGAYNYDGSQAAVVTCKAELNISLKAQFLRPNEEEKCCEASSITTSHSFMHPLLLMIAGHLGRDVAIKLLQQGAAQILHEAKKVNEKAVDNTI